MLRKSSFQSISREPINKSASKTTGRPIRPAPPPSALLHRGTLNELFIKEGKPSFKHLPRETLVLNQAVPVIHGSFPYKKRALVPQRVEHGISLEQTALLQLIEPGSQRGAPYRTLFLFLHLSY